MKPLGYFFADFHSVLVSAFVLIQYFYIMYSIFDINVFNGAGPQFSFCNFYRVRIRTAAMFNVWLYLREYYRRLFSVSSVNVIELWWDYMMF